MNPAILVEAMTMQLATTSTAIQALQLVTELQTYLVSHLDALPPPASKSRFHPITWLRADGVFGGGTRLTAHDEELFNRASVNVSQVQYESDPRRSMGSATAISTIVHPKLPIVPSMHMHVSWTEMKSGKGYWRMMGDLNPALPVAADQDAFEAAFREVSSPQLYAYGTAQGAKYFHIPALQRHRGVAHFYLEEYSSANFADDLDLARRFGRKVIETYAAICRNILTKPRPVSLADWSEQLAYHSIYFLQVLTLDRGTTSGLLVHSENDVGILGSLPSHVSKSLLKSFVPWLPELQQKLLTSLLTALPDGPKSLIDDSVKAKLAQLTREFYERHPEAQDLMARADKLPPTQQNHR